MEKPIKTTGTLNDFYEFASSQPRDVVISSGEAADDILVCMRDVKTAISTSDFDIVIPAGGTKILPGMSVKVISVTKGALVGIFRYVNNG